MNAYNKALANGKQQIALAKEFNTLYPSAICSYTYFYDNTGRRVITCQTKLYERYVLAMEIRGITFDHGYDRIHSTGPSHILLTEIAAFQGRMMIHGQSWQISEDKWNELYRNHGNYSAIGIDLVTNQPTPGFRQWWATEVERASTGESRGGE
jgi:hypothetical protein